MKLKTILFYYYSKHFFQVGITLPNDILSFTFESTNTYKFIQSHLLYFISIFRNNIIFFDSYHYNIMLVDIILLRHLYYNYKYILYVYKLYSILMLKAPKIRPQWNFFSKKYKVNGLLTFYIYIKFLVLVIGSDKVSW